MQPLVRVSQDPRGRGRGAPAPERDLHDGAQQRLVALSLEFGLLEQRFEDDAEAQRAIDQVRRELGESLQELRDLARGIHPVIVTRRGLVAAAGSLAARSPVPVELDIDVGERPPEVVEVASYYLLAEALTNVAKYARASRATVEVNRTSGWLAVEVADDGVGGADPAGGSGLRGLNDRIEALGGRLRVRSPAGGGTRVRAELPCEQPGVAGPSAGRVEPGSRPRPGLGRSTYPASVVSRMRRRAGCVSVRVEAYEGSGDVMRRTNAAPRWVEGARRYRARRGPLAHHDGTCDALYPGTADDREGRCLLAEGHEGAHVYRGRGPARKPTRTQSYQAERDERKRLARVALRRERRERAARIY